MKRVFVTLLAVAFASAFLQNLLWAAKKYPSKPITFVVPHGPGGMSDITARLLAEKFKFELEQPVLVVNKAGANGILGTKYALAQKSDGYTVIIGTLTDIFASPYFQGIKPFNLKDFLFVGSCMPRESVLLTTPDKPYKTFQEFIAYVKENPGQLSVASAGALWAQEVIKSIAVKEGLKMKYAMFKSGGEASTAILGKHVDLCETGTGTPAFHAARDGKLIALVNLGPGSVPFFPDVKNVKQLGYPYSTVIEYGMAVRAATPEPIRKTLEGTLGKVLHDIQVADKMLHMGLTPRFLDGKSLEKLIQDAIKSVPELIEYNKSLQEG
jgi:tripartite-type tricarboxylate transporter receptor subunit TctC